MGKNQSKHSLGFYRRRPGPNGECFGSHGHFNPLAVTEGEDLLVIRSFSKVESDGNCGVAVVKVDSGLDESDKCPLQVILPPEGPRDTDSCATKRKMSEAITLPDTDKNTNELSVEEFECNVSVKADTGMERQEFLFTLYDLDGHGKITKDDIAGLVRSIYEAVGTSIKLPVTGSKTIKVRLTVSPDKKNVDTSGTKPCEEPQEQKAVADSDAHEKLVRCLSVLGGVSDTSPPPIPPCPAEPPTPPPREPNCHHRHHHHHHHHNPNQNNEAGPCSSPRRKTRFTSAASLQRNELLEILQANLEKNSVGYQPVRKHQRSRQNQQQPQHHHACGAQQQQQTPHGHHHHHRNRTVECRDRRNHYLDLAGVENFAIKLGNVHHNRHHAPEPGPAMTGLDGDSKEGPAACPYVLLDRSHVCSKGGRRTKKGHHRSRSHDLNDGAAAKNHSFFQHETVEGEDAIWQRINNSNNNNNKNNCLNHEYGRSKSYDAALHPTANWGCGAPIPNVVLETTSPRAHNRHRHREREHARAMQQVAHWIQKGHIGGLGPSPNVGNATADRGEERGGGGAPDPNAPSPGKNGNPVLVERHEHHHVHHHHHYHYKDL